LDAKKEFDSYVQAQAHAGSPADELHKLAELKEEGALSAEEFDRAKSKFALAGIEWHTVAFLLSWHGLGIPFFQVGILV
jgi:multidrug resistance efflux pump